MIRARGAALGASVRASPQTRRCGRRPSCPPPVAAALGRRGCGPLAPALRLGRGKVLRRPLRRPPCCRARRRWRCAVCSRLKGSAALLPAGRCGGLPCRRGRARPRRGGAAPAGPVSGRSLRVPPRSGSGKGQAGRRCRPCLCLRARPLRSPSVLPRLVAALRRCASPARGCAGPRGSPCAERLPGPLRMGRALNPSVAALRPRAGALLGGVAARGRPALGLGRLFWRLRARAAPCAVLGFLRRRRLRRGAGALALRLRYCAKSSTPGPKMISRGPRSPLPSSAR